MFNMLYRAKFISIPELDFTEFGEVLNIKSDDDYRIKDEITILFNCYNMENYDKLTKKNIRKQ